MYAEELAREALQPVSDHGVPDPRTHGDAEPRGGTIGWTSNDDEVLCVTSSTFALERQELTATADARRLREAELLAHSLTPAASGESRR
jgi:hypothetical protein